jgi:hypothetical protein
VEGENGVPPKGLWQQDTSVYTNSTRSLFAKSQNEDVLFDIQQYDKILKKKKKKKCVSNIKKKIIIKKNKKKKKTY